MRMPLSNSYTNSEVTDILIDKLQGEGTKKIKRRKKKKKSSLYRV